MTRPVLSLALLLPGQVLAATLNVPGQYPNLGIAVSLASDGDVIVVAPGDYSGENTLSIVGKTLSIVGSAPDEVTLPPIYLDSFGTDAGDLSLSSVGLPCESAPAVQAVTGNLRLSNVQAVGCAESRPTIEMPNTYGILQELVIEDSLFQDLESRTFGAVRAKGATVVISNTRFENVRALVGAIDPDCPSDSCGGAIAARDSDLTVVDSSFVDCSAGEGGGGLVLWGQPERGEPEHHRLGLQRHLHLDRRGGPDSDRWRCHHPGLYLHQQQHPDLGGGCWTAGAGQPAIGGAHRRLRFHWE